LYATLDDVGYTEWQEQGDDYLMTMNAQRIALFEQGPFAGKVDPWAEDWRYFQMLHSGMIDALIDMTRKQLAALGYYAGRETSMQILDGREPDVFIRFGLFGAEKSPQFSYELAAAEVLADAGIAFQEIPVLEAIHILDKAGMLVTVIEVISPRNKHRTSEIQEYKKRRWHLCLENGINVVEIDLTRSVLRLAAQQETRWYPYHVAVFMPQRDSRIIGLQLEERLKRIAIPLRGEVVPVELHDVYQSTYEKYTVAQHIQLENGYAEDALPFPSLLTDEQRAEAVARVRDWQQKLTAL
jgi:hypothetical protein